MLGKQLLIKNPPPLSEGRFPTLRFSQAPLSSCGFLRSLLFQFCSHLLSLVFFGDNGAVFVIPSLCSEETTHLWFVLVCLDEFSSLNQKKKKNRDHLLYSQISRDCSIAI